LRQSAKISPNEYEFFGVPKGKYLSFASHLTQPHQLLELLYVERDADVIVYSNEAAAVLTHKKDSLWH
jgi:hypothetical protein